MVVRILLLSPFFSPNVGGVETHLDDVCRALGRRGHEVEVMTYQPLTTRVKGAGVERRPGVTIRRWPWIRGNFFHVFEAFPPIQFLYLVPGLLIASWWRMRRARGSIQVIFAHGLAAGWIGTVLKKMFHVPLVVSIHAVYNFDGRGGLGKQVADILKSADGGLCLSRQSQREFEQIGLEPRRVSVFSYWVDQERFRPMDQALCQERTQLRAKLVVLFVGRMIAIKGMDVMLDVARRLKDQDVLFAFAGDGPEAGRVKSTAAELPNVRFIGRVSNDDLPAYYNAADVTVVPSQYEEGYGRVILESLSCGTPVFATRRGGVPEALDETVGRLMDPTSANFFKVLEEVRASRSMLEALAARSRAYAEAKFSERNVEAIERGLKQAVEDRSLS